MEWSEPGISFRVTFKKLDYDRHKTKKDILTDDYGRSQPITTDYD